MASLSRGCCTQLHRLNAADSQWLLSQVQALATRQLKPFRHAHLRPQRTFSSSSLRAKKGTAKTLNTRKQTPAKRAKPPNEEPTVKPTKLVQQYMARQNIKAAPEKVSEKHGASLPKLPDTKIKPSTRKADATGVASRPVETLETTPPGSSTLLYSNIGRGDYTAFIAAIAGGYCIAYGGTWIYDACFVHHPGLWRPVNYMNGFGGIVVAIVGVSILGRMKGQAGRVEVFRSLKRGGPMRIRVEGRTPMRIPGFGASGKRWVPLYKPTVIEADAEAWTLSTSVAGVKRAQKPLTAEQRAQGFRDAAAQDQTGGLGVMLYYPKKGFQAFKSMFLKVLLGEGYVNLIGPKRPGRTLDQWTAIGRTFRLDTKVGWLLEDGEPLDRAISKKLDRA